MEKKNQNEEFQSRREFFKKAAKGALPILGAIVLAGSPLLTKASVSPSGCSKYGCGTCTGSCRNTCSGGCSTTCRGTCDGSCKDTCLSTCKGGCSHYACKGVANR